MTGAVERPGTDMVRAEAVRVLEELNQTTKAQQAFLTSCGDATWIGEEERHAIRWLLSALVEHRKRLRVTGRMWRTLTVDEPVARALASATTDLLDENRSFTPFIARWREVVVEQTRMERNEFWRSMIELAEQNMTDGHDSEWRCAPSWATTKSSTTPASRTLPGSGPRPLMR